MTIRTRAHSILVLLVGALLVIAGCGADTEGKKKGGGTDGGDDAGQDGAQADGGGNGKDGGGGGDGGPSGDAGADAPPATDCHGTRSCANLAGLACSLAGCENEAGGDCGGTPAACSTYDSEPVKCFTSGCQYKVGMQKCEGTPNDCDEVNINVCGTDFGPDGCTPSGACSGTADPCSDYTVEQICAAQPGCSWM